MRTKIATLEEAEAWPELQYRRGAEILGMSWQEVTDIFGDTPEKREKLLPQFMEMVLEQYVPPVSNRRKLVQHTKKKMEKKNAQQKRSRKRNRR
jgi:hypothetical protein